MACKCKCGANMRLTRATDCYQAGNVFCDECRQRLHGTKLIYHCPRGKTAPHTGGWDICKDCAAKQNPKSKSTLSLFGNDSDDDLFSAFSSNPAPQKTVTCECGAKLQFMKAVDCYAASSSIACNYCLQKVGDVLRVYHCPRNKIAAHPHGFDLCAFCADHQNVASQCTKALRQRLELFEKAYTDQNVQIQRLKKMNSKLEEERKETEMEMEALKEQVAALKLKAIDPSLFMEWEWEDIVHWILSLEEGRYKMYEGVLRKSLSEAEMKGEWLPEVDDFNSEVNLWGVKPFKDRRNLAKHFQDLVKRYCKQPVAKEAEAAAAAYPSPGGMNETEEGGATALHY